MTRTSQENHLLTLSQQWQSRLTRSNRAVFPWNPQEVEKPTSTVFPPTTSKSRTPTLPSNFVKSEPTESNTFHPSPAIGGVRIKQEPGIYDTSFLNLPQNNSHIQSQQFLPVGGPFRAAHLIGQQFGSQANASVAALQAAGMSLPGGQQRPHGLQLPGQVQSHPQYQQQHQQQPPQQPLKQPKQESRPNGLGLSQTDGAGDSIEQWDAVIARRNAVGDHDAMGRIAVDGMISRQVKEMARRLEGGGLMLPLDDRRPVHCKSRRARSHARETPALIALSTTALSGTGEPSCVPVATASSASGDGTARLPRFDGGDDSSPEPDIESDEDAINSELDDSDDGVDDGIQASMEGDVILCLYDKVQRVKNKWKCTLKDGVVTVDNKE